MKILFYIAILALTTSFGFKSDFTEKNHRSLKSPEKQESVELKK